MGSASRTNARATIASDAASRASRTTGASADGSTCPPGPSSIRRPPTSIPSIQGRRARPERATRATRPLKSWPLPAASTRRACSPRSSATMTMPNRESTPISGVVRTTMASTARMRAWITTVRPAR